MKKATTVEQQIEKLRERGMDIDIDEEKAIAILNDIGYFRLGFYCFPFEEAYPDKKNRTHQYKEGTRFSDVIALHDFDMELRRLLACCLNRIEINFRTNIIYTVSNQYVNNNTWFINHSVMKRDFIDKFNKEFYTPRFRSDHPVITHHHKKYPNDNYAPAWKTLEYLTFGRLVRLYKSLKDERLKKKISEKYSVRNEKKLENYFDALVETRNVCAHNLVLFDHKSHRRLQSGHLVTMSKNSSQTFSVIKIVYFILCSICQERADKMKDETKALFNKYAENNLISRIIDDSMSYDNDW